MRTAVILRLSLHRPGSLWSLDPTKDGGGRRQHPGRAAHGRAGEYRYSWWNSTARQVTGSAIPRCAAHPRRLAANRAGCRWARAVAAVSGCAAAGDCWPRTLLFSLGAIGRTTVVRTASSMTRVITQPRLQDGVLPGVLAGHLAEYLGPGFSQRRVEGRPRTRLERSRRPPVARPRENKATDAADDEGPATVEASVRAPSARDTNVVDC